MSSVLITGASSGIGKAIATRFAQQGYNLILLARREDKLAELKAALPTNVHTICCDVTDHNRLKQHITEIPAAFLPISGLINNAGLALGRDLAQNCELDDWLTMVNTNITALIALTHMVLPFMINENQGHIINMGSIAGTWPYPGGNVYGATKAFLHQFTRNIKADVWGTNIRVSSVEPGMVATDFSLVRYKGDKAKADATYAGVDCLQPEDIAEIVYWIYTQPLRVNINQVEVMPTCQAWDNLRINR